MRQSSENSVTSTSSRTPPSFTVDSPSLWSLRVLYSKPNWLQSSSASNTNSSPRRSISTLSPTSHVRPNVAAAHAAETPKLRSPSQAPSSNRLTPPPSRTTTLWSRTPPSQHGTATNSMSSMPLRELPASSNLLRAPSLSLRTTSTFSALTLAAASAAKVTSGPIPSSPRWQQR